MVNLQAHEQAVRELMHAHIIIEIFKLSAPVIGIRDTAHRLHEMGFTEGEETPFREKERSAAIRACGKRVPLERGDES